MNRFVSKAGGCGGLGAVAVVLLVAGCAAPPEETEASAVTEDPPVAAMTGPVAPPTTDPEMIASAMAAAPRSIAETATILAISATGEVRTVRQGTGAFTCVPDGPSPGVDPMCVDANGLIWVQALMAQQPPPEGLVGFGYMLAGGSDASNTDPFATAPAAGGQWVDTGPHVMVFGGDLTGYPTTHSDTSHPFLMFPGTPYEHLMAPVQ